MINVLIKKCRNLISMIKRSSVITSFFETERKKYMVKRNLSYDVKSRWNSTFIMIDSLLSLREVLEKLFSYKNHLRLKAKQLAKLSRLELANDDWDMLSMLHLVLKPFYHATKVLSGRQYPSIGIAVYILVRLKSVLQLHERKESVMFKRFKQLLLSKFLHYFESDYDQLQLLKVTMINQLLLMKVTIKLCSYLFSYTPTLILPDLQH